MSVPIQIELIHLIPTLVWAAVVLLVVLLFRSVIREQVLPRLSRVSAFGLELEIAVKQELDRAALEGPTGTEAERTQTARRAARLGPILRGARVLLVNDVPAQMIVVTGILRSLGIAVEVATTTEAALDALRRNGFDVVVSDMSRGDEATAGLDLIREMRAGGHPQPVVLTVGRYEPERGVPGYAFGITNRVDELLNLVFDALERIRG